MYSRLAKLKKNEGVLVWNTSIFTITPITTKQKLFDISKITSHYPRFRDYINEL